MTQTAKAIDAQNVFAAKPLATAHVYEAICAVTAAMAKEGISKSRKNEQQGYKFRGIDDVYNALAPHLSANSIVMLPRVLAREMLERRNAKGNPLYYVTVDMEFDLVSGKDGSSHTIRTFGEAMDSADKATNKAMSAAYKYAAMQAFCIPTEGDNDADATTHEVAATSQDQPPAGPVLINEEQARRIVAKLNEKGLAAHAFTRMARIPTIGALEAARFDGAFKWLSQQPTAQSQNQEAA